MMIFVTEVYKEVQEACGRLYQVDELRYWIFAMAGDDQEMVMKVQCWPNVKEGLHSS